MGDGDESSENFDGDLVISIEIFSSSSRCLRGLDDFLLFFLLVITFISSREDCLPRVISSALCRLSEGLGDEQPKLRPRIDDDEDEAIIESIHDDDDDDDDEEDEWAGETDRDSSVSCLMSVFDLSLCDLYDSSKAMGDEVDKSLSLLEDKFK